ncbi:MAG TPA: hypothetical protein VFR02_06265 [bacterium]|nr:hypothetical protein [bacterium]
MKTMREEGQSCLSRFPAPEDLVLLFERFMAYWCGERVKLAGLGLGAPGPGSPEFMVRWRGAVPGTLSLRFDPGFYPWLVRRRDFKHMNLYTEDALLQEITALYGIYLIQYFSMADLADAGPLLPRRAPPGQLPARGPDSQIGIRVEECPLEIRFWAGDGP